MQTARNDSPSSMHGVMGYGRIGRTVFAALMIVTGGSMLAGAGEVTALVLPVKGSDVIGILGTMVLGWWLANHEIRGLAGVSKALTGCLVGVMAAGLWLSPASVAVVAMPVTWERLGNMLLRALCYGGFNVALAAPVLEETAHVLQEKQRRRCVITACVVLGFLLMLGNAVLLRHPALIGEALPFLHLTEAFGWWGYGLSAMALYLAMLTTLGACLRGVRMLLRRRWCMWLPLGIAMMGFSQVVEWLYPLLGGACFLMLAMQHGHRERKTSDPCAETKRFCI